VRKIAGFTDALGRLRIGKDAVSRISARLQKEQRNWRERSLEKKDYPYLYLNATYLKVRSGASVTNLALLACVGVDEEGFREVLAVEVAGSEKGAAYASLRGLIDLGLKGVRLVSRSAGRLSEPDGLRIEEAALVTGRASNAEITRLVPLEDQGGRLRLQHLPQGFSHAKYSKGGG
jgi:Transposase, Mutator family